MFNKWLLVYSQNCTFLFIINFRIFPLPQKERLSCYSLLPVPRQPPIYFFSLFTYSDLSCKWNHIICGTLWLVSFTYHVFKIHLCCTMYQYFFKKHFIYFLTTQCSVACRISILWPGIEPGPWQYYKKSTKSLPLVCARMLSCFSRVELFGTLWTVACQSPLSVDSPGKNTGVGCHVLLHVIFPTQGLNPHLLRWQADSLSLAPLGKLPFLFMDE